MLSLDAILGELYTKAVATNIPRESRAGVIVYFRKEGRALGEVTKYLVYNLRKRQEGGDTAKEYFRCTQQVRICSDCCCISTN